MKKLYGNYIGIHLQWMIKKNISKNILIKFRYEKNTKYIYTGLLQYIFKNTFLKI